MILELHTWGPAFGLPSIDPQCLAAIAYLAITLPIGHTQKWVVIPDSDPNIVPTNELPALWTGSVWVSGFRNIVDFLKKYTDGEWDLDQWMNTDERADRAALSSFVELHGQPLIDLSLYVSSENYRAVTSPAYGTMLQWPNQWIIPPQIRSQAKARTEHLGLSSLDLDAMEEERQQGRDANLIAASRIPKSLATKPLQTVSSLLGKTSRNSRIRLRGLTERFVGPLQERLQGKDYLLAEVSASSLDCLAVGYLSLMLVPELPFSWLKDDILALAPGLADCMDKLRVKFFGTWLDAAALLQRADPCSASILPWQISQRLSLGAVGLRIVDGIMDSIPVIRDIRLHRRLRKLAQEDPQHLELVGSVADQSARELLMSVATVTVGLGTLFFYIFKAGLIQVERVVPSEKAEEDIDEISDEKSAPMTEHKEAPPSQPMGEAGAMLGL